MAADVPRILLNVWRVLQICAFWFINKRLTEPYMDEIFHVPQAQAYCRGQFANYDPKLTTPPGLYLVSYILHLVGLPCDVAYLRYVNLFVGTILLPSLCSRIWALRHVGANRQDLQWAKCIAMMPLLSFFSLLYYTDVASIYLVLLAYYLVLCKRPASSAAIGLLSLFFRQTNIVWIAAFAAMGLVDQFRSTSHNSTMDISFHETSILSSFESVIAVVQTAIVQWRMTLKYVATFCPIGIFAALFLYWNGSIVLGDKEMHQAGFYPIQIVYMTSFAVAVSAPLFLHRSTLYNLSNGLKRPVILTILLPFCFWTAQFKNIQHSFVLSDNRHYPFYVNRWIIQRLPVKVLGTAFLCSSSLFISRVSHVRFLEMLLVAIATGCTLAPTSLLEFRYYLIPYLLWRLEANETQLSRGTRLCEVLLWLTIHIVTLWLFVFKAFHWEGSEAEQRFMW